MAISKDGYDIILSRNDASDVVTEIGRDRARPSMLRYQVREEHSNTAVNTYLDMNSHQFSYSLLQPGRGYAVPISQAEFVEAVGSAEVDNSVREVLKLIGLGIGAEHERYGELNRKAQPRSRGGHPAGTRRVDPAAGKLLEDAERAIQAERERLPGAARDLWVKNWPIEEREEWREPEKPRHDGPQSTTQELLQQEDDTWRFYEQRQVEDKGGRARLFAFNAATGGSLTWEWDKEKEKPHISDPSGAVKEFRKLDHWEGFEKLVNDKAKALAGVVGLEEEKEGPHAAQESARRAASGTRGAERV